MDTVCVHSGILCRHVGHAVYMWLRSACACLFAFKHNPGPAPLPFLKTQVFPLFFRELHPSVYKGHTRPKQPAWDRCVLRAFGGGSTPTGSTQTSTQKILSHSIPQPPKPLSTFKTVIQPVLSQPASPSQPVLRDAEDTAVTLGTALMKLSLHRQMEQPHVSEAQNAQGWCEKTQEEGSGVGGADRRHRCL